MIVNPYLLPKVRSESLRGAAPYMPCCLRIAGFAGLQCASVETNVMCHLPVHGKGVATKVSDLHMACGCRVCHDLLDSERNPTGLRIRETYPHAFWERLFRAHAETLDRWLSMGLIPSGPDWEII